jgi:uncharacterized integral membrane protein (TIGR00698 family)
MRARRSAAAREGERSHLRWPSAGLTALPGLVLAGVGVALSLGAHAAEPAMPPLVLCVALGALLANTVGVPQRARPGLQLAAGPVLKLGVVLLGLDLVFPDILALGLKALLVVVAVVAITFFGTQWAGRRIGISANLSLLVATGFSICGVSAIAAANGVVDADEDEVAFSVALVTLCGTLAIVVLPPLRHLLGLDDEQFGAWVGASVHDVAQVVATSSTAGAVALATAIVVKLTRVMLLAPMIAGIAVRRGRGEVHGAEQAGARRPPLVPPFIVAFVAMVAVASLGVLPDRAIARIDDLRTVLLGLALFALGSRVDIGRLRKIGPRPLALGLASWLLIAIVSYAGVRLAWA